MSGKIGENFETMDQGNKRNLYLITLCVSIAFMALGVTSAWATPVLAKFSNNETNVDIDKNQVSVLLSMFPVGFATGSLLTRYIADQFGRRATILCSAVPITIGSVIAAFALKAWLLYITAFAWQCGTGMMSTIIGIYLAEIADKDSRATLQLITSFTFKFGTLLTMTLGPILSYDALNYITVALPTMYFVVCWWIPETPHFCLKNGNVDAARKSLKILRGYKDNKVLEDELLALETDVKKEMTRSSSLIELLTGKQYRKALGIGIGLKVIEKLTGGVLIKQYLAWIVTQTGLNLKTSLVLIIYGCVTFFISLISSILVNRVGRRPLMIYSCFGTGIVLGTISIYFFLQEFYNLKTNLTTYSFIPFLCILLVNIISTLGFNSLIFVIPAEIFPMNVKAVAMPCLNIFGCVIAFTTARAYQSIIDACGYATVFLIFASAGIIGGIFSYYVLPETKGLKLGEIQAELQGRVYDGGNMNEVIDDNATELQELKTGDKSV